MEKYRYDHLSVYMQKKEWILGLCFLPFYFVGIELILALLCRLLGVPLDVLSLNLLWLLLDSIALLLILMNYLVENGRHFPRFGRLLKELLAGFGLQLLGGFAVSAVEVALAPYTGGVFDNMNDAFIADSFGGTPVALFAIGCVLAPFVEECIFRGIIFSNLYRLKKWAAYVVTCVFFIGIHVVPYIGQLSPLELLLSVLDYLPATLVLCRVYRRTDCIYASMLYHGLQNLLALSLMMLY